MVPQVDAQHVNTPTMQRPIVVERAEVDFLAIAVAPVNEEHRGDRLLGRDPPGANHNRLMGRMQLHVVEREPEVRWRTNDRWAVRRR